MARFGIILIGLLIAIFTASGQKPRNNAPITENYNCLRCHGQAVYTAFSSDGTKHEKQPMAECRVINSRSFQNAIHGSLKCVDCHAEGYSTTPHPVDLKFEPLYTCSDCHEGRKKFKKYHLDSIQAGYDKSVHAKAMANTFNCWKCHNPHSFITPASDSMDLKAAVTLSNSACLDCHNNAATYNRVSDKMPKNILKAHDWLIHPELHLANIRCVDCHTKVSAGSFTAHQILPADKAVRECTACHSQKSILSLSLFRSKKGNESFLNFSNSRALDYAFIMGANRSITLNIISLILFGTVLLVIMVHLSFVIRYRKSHKNG